MRVEYQEQTHTWKNKNEPEALVSCLADRASVKAVIEFNFPSVSGKNNSERGCFRILENKEMGKIMGPFLGPRIF